MSRSNPRRRRHAALVPWLVFVAPIGAILLIFLFFFSPLCAPREAPPGGVAAPPPTATVR
jgi:hypothetical protein